MPTFREGVFDNRQHRIVALGIKDIARADKNLNLICLGTRLIEALGQILQVERDKIDDAPALNAQALPLSDFQSSARIFRHGFTFQKCHPILLLIVGERLRSLPRVTYLQPLQSLSMSPT